MRTRINEKLGHRVHLAAWAAASALLFTGCLVDYDYDDEDLYDTEEVSDEGGDSKGELTTKASYYDPVGTHDVANCNILAGWAKDGDTTAPIQVHIYKGAPYPSGTHVVNVVANKYRADLPFADKNHGFQISTPAAFKTGYWEKVYIHAINYDTNGNPTPPGVGNNPLLAQTGKSICCGANCNQPPDPPGCLIDCPQIP